MTGFKIKNVLGGLAISALSAVMGTMAYSAVVPSTASCASLVGGLVPDVTNDVSPTSACYVLQNTNGNVTNHIDEFNATNFGGFADWVTLGKITPPATAGTNFDMTFDAGGASSGRWTVKSSVYSAYESLVLLFKSGEDNDKVEPGNEIGYILAGATGDWKNPSYTYSPTTYNPDGTVKKLPSLGDRKDLSHVELYARLKKEEPCVPGAPGCDDSGPTPVPLPAGLPLLLTGLAVFGWMSRKTRKSA